MSNDRDIEDVIYAVDDYKQGSNLKPYDHKRF